MHVHCPGPCCITKSILHVHVHVACSCQCCIPCQCFMSMSMPECWTVQHPVSLVLDWKKLMMPKPVWYRTKLTQSGIFLVRYRTKIQDAEMPMPVLVSLMSMPSYADIVLLTENGKGPSLYVSVVYYLDAELNSCRYLQSHVTKKNCYILYGTDFECVCHERTCWLFNDNMVGLSKKWLKVQVAI